MLVGQVLHQRVLVVFNVLKSGLLIYDNNKRLD